MRADVLVAEIGSTVTKVHAFAGLETRSPSWLGHGLAPTSVLAGDVTVGLRQAIADFEAAAGEKLEWARMLAASSAAGGLRMSVHGLVADMTVRAAREAALGAGAVLGLVTSGEMGTVEIEALRQARPGIILLAGGVEGGDRAVIVHNARAVASSHVKAPVVYAGNAVARAEVSEILEEAGLEVRPVPNVYPRLDRLDIEPARRAIQDVFEEHIVAAPGMERVREMVAGTIQPTPGAVMEAARAMRNVVGDLVVVDVGGATTDIHSVTDGSAEIGRLQVHPEPVAKRTVEGDLGVYVNAANVVRVAGEEDVAGYMEAIAGEEPGAAGPSAGRQAIGVREILARLEPLPPETMDPAMSLFVEALARIAAETALLRHAGRLRHLFGPTGRVTIAEGKDLTEVEWLVGTGGPLTRFPHALATLSKLAGLSPGAVGGRDRRGDLTGHCLVPGLGARPLLDRRYVLAVLGVLRREYPEAAVRLLEESFERQLSGGGPS